MASRTNAHQAEHTKQLYIKGNAIEAIALEVGISQSSVRRILARQGLRKAADTITPTQRAMLEELEANGISDVISLRYILNKR